MQQSISIDQLAGILGTFIQQQQNVNNTMQQQLVSQQESINRLISLLEANTQAANVRNQPATQPTGGQTPVVQPITQPNTVEGRIPFNEIVERYVRTNLPQVYQEAFSRPDYSPTWWSWSLEEAAPVYTQGLSTNRLTRKRVLFNDRLYSEIPRGSIARYRNLYPERFRAIDDANYNPTNLQNMVMLSDATRVNEQTTRQITQNQLRKNLKSQGLQYVRQDPNARYMAQSLSVGELRTLEPNIGTILPGIETLTERAFFNGIVTETEYVLNLDAFSVGTSIEITIPPFMELIKRAFIKQTSQDIGPYNLPPYYSLYLWYVRGEIRILDPITLTIETFPPSHRRIKVFSGTVFNALATNFVIEPDLEAELLQLTGSDVIELAAHALDMLRFIIQKVDLTRTGGSAILLKHYRESRTESNSKNHYVYTLPWGKIWDYDPKNNGCFMQIINIVLKEQNRNQYIRYEDLWRQISPETYHQELSFEQASNIAQQLGFMLYIYNADGQIIHGNVNANPNTALSPLRVLYFENHYMMIKELYSSADNENQPQVSAENVKAAKDFTLVLGFYDLETVYVEEAGAESNLRPYSISWLIQDNAMSSIKVMTVDIPTTDIFDNLINDLREHGPGYRFILIAYNGSGFDHVFLFSYLVRRGYRVRTAPKASGKIRHMKFWISYGAEGYSMIEVWDPYLFVMRSLDQAATDFGLSTKKLPFNHEEVQTAYLTGRLSEFLKQNKKMIEDYNRQDVRILMLFTTKLLETLSKLTSMPVKTILSCQTLPGLCYKFWQRMISSQPNAIIPKAVKDVKIDKKIRSATIGGRVEGTPGIYHGNFRMVDVVSLYPTVMAIYDYPLIEEIVVKDMNLAIQYYNQNYLGVYHIEYEQSALITEHTILPERTNDNKLSWTKGSGRGWVPIISIQLLIGYGAKVIMVPDEEGDVAIVWNKTGNVFKQYVDLLSKIKQEQDMFKTVGNPKYNNSLREMVKLMLNSLSGKVIQRNFDNASVFVQSERELTDVLNSLAKADWVKQDVSIAPVTTNSAFVEYKIIDPYRKPMPSQLGIFIYAYARAYMFQNVFSRTHVYYSDTDSAVIDFDDYNKLPVELVPVQYQNNGVQLVESVIREKQFGDLELEEAIYELSDTEKIKIKQYTTIVVIAPKIYALYYQNQIVKYRLKGVRKMDEFYDPAAVIEGVEDSGWKPIEKYVYNTDTDKYQRIERNVERLFQLLAERFTNPESTVRIRSWQFKRVVRQGRIERLTLEKII